MSSPFALQRGTNVSHWLSQSKRRGAERRAFFSEDDVRRIAGWGLDHIRLPIDEEQMFHEDGTPDEEAFDLLTSGLRWALGHGLNVVVDLHILRSHYFNDAQEPRLYTDPAEADRFADLWRTLSQRIGDAPTDRVAYELLNEPVARSAAGWNRVYPHPYRAIREREPQRTIVLGSNHFQSPNTFDELEVPEDEKLILSFHFYHPMFITHYRARWTPCGPYDGPIQYPGPPVPPEGVLMMDEDYRRQLDAWHDWNQPAGPDLMRRLIQKPLAVARRMGLGLYCGEFGCRDVVPRAIRRAWYRDFLGVLEENGIAWANWDYRGGFGIIDAQGHDSGILDLVTDR